MSPPLVTIGLTYRNPGPFLSDAMKSVLAQSFTDWELVIVDDGSTDGSREYVEAVTDNRVRIVEPDGSGFVAGLNAITRAAKGEYVARFDVDDLMHPDRLATQVSFLEAHPGVDVVDSAVYVTNRSREPVGVRGMARPAASPAVALRHGILIHPTILARRDWMLSNPYDAAFPRAEDRELFVRTMRNSTFASINEPLYFYLFEGHLRLNAFLQSYASERQVIRRYGPGLVGCSRSAGLWATSMTKSVAIVALHTLHLDRIVTQRSYVPLPEDRVAEAQRTIEQVRATAVPLAPGYRARGGE